MKYITLFLAGFLLSCCLAAQDQATLYLLNGDSLPGYIFEHSLKAEAITFSTRKTGGEKQKFEASEIKGYWIGDRRYESEAITYYQARNLEDGGQGVRPPKKSRQAFLEVLFDGNMRLLSFTDEDAWKHYFVQEPDRAAKELAEFEYEERRKMADGSMGLVTVKQRLYQVMLSSLFADCPKVVDKLSALILERRQLIKVFLDYHECVGSGEEVFLQDTKLLTLRPGIALGGLANWAVVGKRGVFSNVTESSVGPLFGWSVGIDLDFTINRTNGLWSLRSQPGIAIVNQTYTEVFNQTASRYDENTFTMNSLLIRLPFSARRYISTRSFTPFFEFGALLQIWTKEPTMTWTIYRGTWVDINTPEVVFQAVKMPLFVSLGLRYKSLAMEFRYEMPVLPDIFFSSGKMMKTIYAGLSWNY